MKMIHSPLFRRVMALLVLTLTGCFLPACSPEPEPVRPAEIVVGGLYASKNGDGTFSVSKVLGLDKAAVHVRIYANKFTALPQKLDTATLTLGKLGDPGDFGVGHAPVARNGWLDSHTFLRKEKVRDEELEGYALYMEEQKR